VIKSHHNVGGLPEDLGLDLVEALRRLFKDEVRAVATELGLPDRSVWRQPFPGPVAGGGQRLLRLAQALAQRFRREAPLLRESGGRNGFQISGSGRGATGRRSAH